MSCAKGVEALPAVIEASAVGNWARTSSIGYPAANLVHLLGLVMLVGGIGLVDLRVAGLFRTLPAGALARALIPLAAAGVVLMLLSGAVMFAADAGPLARSPMFLTKVSLIAVALVNVVAFHVLWRKRMEHPPLTARVMAIGSIALWLSIATLGRLIGYT